MLELFGIDSAAELVYRTMLLYPQDGVDSLARRLNLGGDETRAALETLSRLALVRPSDDSQEELHAVRPEVGLEALLARQQAELASRQERVEASRAAAAELISEYAAHHPAATEPGVELLRGVEEIRDRLALLTEQVRREVLAFAPGGPQTPENIRASKPLSRRLLDRGVRMRTIYLDSIRNDTPSVEHAVWLTEAGAEIRTAPALPPRMIILDRETALVSADGEDSSQGATLLTRNGTVAALCVLFENVWASGQVLGEPRPRDHDGLTAQEKAAVRLLADGFTDDAIAKRLGVSPRTARRIASDLIERLDARSRFQAGAHAAERGWLKGDE